MSVNTHKGLALRLYILGLHPLDLVVVCFLTFMVWGFTFQPVITIVCMLSSYFTLRRFKNVDIETRKIFFRFLVAPARLAIKNADIQGYRSCLK